MPPIRPELDSRAFRDALTLLAEMTGQAAVICDENGRVLFANGRARRLLGTQDIPPEITTTAGEHDATVKISLTGTTHPVHARAQRLPGVVRRFLVLLDEQAPRSTLAKSLVSRFGLSARAIQLVQLTSRGLTNREIAEQLHLSEATVKTYMHGLFRDVGVRNRAELVALAERIASSN